MRSEQEQSRIIVWAIVAVGIALIYFSSYLFPDWFVSSEAKQESYYQDAEFERLDAATRYKRWP